MPESVDEGWLQRGEFEAAFSKWLQEVKRHKHVFLGYSSQAASVADSVERFLTEKLGLTVYDWRDFHPGETIWESIENAERLTNCGVFLFMADDDLRSGETRQGAPRDNVVYEAGYYAGAKGRKYAVVIREKGAKVPTDLGGVLYLELTDRHNIAPIETRLRDYFNDMLT